LFVLLLLGYCHTKLNSCLMIIIIIVIKELIQQTLLPHIFFSFYLLYGTVVCFVLIHLF